MLSFVNYPTCTRAISRFALPALLSALTCNQAIANDDWTQVENGGTVVIDVLSNDGNEANPSSLYIVSPPSNGYMYISADGTVTYSHYAGADLSDSFTYSVATYDGRYSPESTVNINQGSQSTTTSDSGVVVANGGSVVMELVSPNNSSLNASTLYIHSPTSSGYLTNISNGSVRYTHYSGAASTDTFSYAVADYSGFYSPPVSVTVTVGDRSTPIDTPPPSLPVPAPAPTLPGDDNGNQSWWQPRASDNLKWQLQLQGDIQLIDGVSVYAADYTASQSSIDAAKAAGAKVKCYISAGSAENWRADFYDFPVSSIGNAYQNWPGEWWLDTSNIDAIAPIMRARMDACRAKGFDAIDADNVNGFENNTGFNLSSQDSINYIRWLANESHARGMAFSLKNSETLIDDVIDSVDMLQTESCFVYSNCENASKMVWANKPVFAVEYLENIDESAFWQACSASNSYGFSMIYRELALYPSGTYLSCN